MVLRDFVGERVLSQSRRPSVIADDLGMTRQAVVYALNREVDLFRIKTLRKYVRAIGGDIEIRFVKK